MRIRVEDVPERITSGGNVLIIRWVLGSSIDAGFGSRCLQESEFGSLACVVSFSFTSTIPDPL